MKNESLDMFRQMKLTGMADAYQAVLSLPINNHPEAHDLIAQLIDAEFQYRTDRRTKMFLRLSKLRYQASIQDIECSEKRNLSKDKLAFLADCNFINRAENVLITGATGCGKSYLACALGDNACLHGYRTLYFNLNRFAEQISLAKTDGSLIKWLDKLKKAKLIILDDFGLQPLSQSVKLSLLQILEDRYGNSATIICSQLPLNAWHAYLDEPTIADAILDRIVPKAHRIDLKGESLRNRSKI
ncbi:IS21-like element helper ATPase IstB [Portibacter lacus]|uniref:ATP-binding protein n=1 Tax=Portibacter lacus TaxID=1099794 RepID=A0AA37WFM0_9BACT|nr:IS21-like element helper ATPase IstB [Portibacter lacus]GLR20216.1 ATP-binding protein [Portibacter lacus]